MADKRDDGAPGWYADIAWFAAVSSELRSCASLGVKYWLPCPALIVRKHLRVGIGNRHWTEYLRR